jgi:hypothetical protein
MAKPLRQLRRNYSLVTIEANLVHCGGGAQAENLPLPVLVAVEASLPRPFAVEENFLVYGGYSGCRRAFGCGSEGEGSLSASGNEKLVGAGLYEQHAYAPVWFGSGRSGRRAGPVDGDAVSSESDFAESLLAAFRNDAGQLVGALLLQYEGREVVERGVGICEWRRSCRLRALKVVDSEGRKAVTPGLPVYATGSPLFKNARIDLGNGKFFEVEARNCSADNKYIQSATLNGRPHNESWLAHDDIAAGGLLVLEMGPAANTAWAAGSVPPSGE